MVSTEEIDSYPVSRARTNSYFCNEIEYFSTTDAIVEKLNHIPLLYWGGQGNYKPLQWVCNCYYNFDSEQSFYLVIIDKCSSFIMNICQYIRQLPLELFGNGPL